jgi:hypothetical protein
LVIAGRREASRFREGWPLIEEGLYPLRIIAEQAKGTLPGEIVASEVHGMAKGSEVGPTKEQTQDIGVDGLKDGDT